MASPVCGLKCMAMVAALEHGQFPCDSKGPLAFHSCLWRILENNMFRTFGMYVGMYVPGARILLEIFSNIPKKLMRRNIDIPIPLLVQQISSINDRKKTTWKLENMIWIVDLSKWYRLCLHDLVILKWCSYIGVGANDCIRRQIFLHVLPTQNTIAKLLFHQTISWPIYYPNNPCMVYVPTFTLFWHPVL